MLVPVACRHSLTMALLIRILIGFFESACFPCVFHFFPIWVPNSEKTFMIPAIMCGSYVGEIIAFSLSGVLASATFVYGNAVYGGWPWIFYVFGMLGLLWFPVWACMAYETPSAHPLITKEEIQLISQGMQYLAYLFTVTASLLTTPIIHSRTICREGSVRGEFRSPAVG
jgi:MFS family permease